MRGLRKGTAAPLMLAVVAALALGIAGCSAPTTSRPATGGAQAVSGNANFSTSTPLPADAVMTVRLSDDSEPDAATAVLGETTVTAGGKKAPVAFSVAYDISKVDPSHLYALQATITAGGTPLFVTKGNTLVITQGRPTTGIALPLKQP